MSVRKLNVIAVDGPAGSGKTTVCSEVARRLGFFFVSSGAIYRSCAWVSIRSNHGLEPKDFVRKLKFFPLEFDVAEGKFMVKYQGRVINGELHDPEVAMEASRLAKIQEVRDFANEVQRSIAAKAPVVVEGRDATTVVFPDACLKIFLTATPEERASRRWQELVSRGVEVAFDEVLKDVIERDKADMGRSIAPLIKDPDAVVIDTTGVSIEDVMNKIVDLYRQRCSGLI
ncbi:MAG: (d)CMP kinase [Thermodesulforhabdaceae bacterium]